MTITSSDRLELDVENFAPASEIDQGFNVELKGEIIKDQKGRKLGKVLASSKNMGVALVDLDRLNSNGANHEYKLLNDFRTYLWQPVWLDMAMRVQEDEPLTESEEEQQPDES